MDPTEDVVGTGCDEFFPKISCATSSVIAWETEGRWEREHILEEGERDGLDG